MTNASKTRAKRIRNHRKIRAKISGTKERPRLAIYKSNTNIYVQLIDDESGKTIAQANSREIKKGNASEKASEIGKMIAERASAQKITKVVFDRGGYKYAGKIKTIAEGAREGGLKF